MRILVADDDQVCRCVLTAALSEWGHEIMTADNGAAAWRLLQHDDASTLAIVDWKMPEIDGLELCRRVRAWNSSKMIYLILLTAHGGTENVINGLKAGADDFIAKPFNRDELLARLNVGIRMVRLQNSLSDRVRDLERALGQVKILQKLLPICCYCKKIRDDQNYWQEVETYLISHSEAKFSHGICPCCYDTIVRPELDRLVAASR